ncbi:MAG: PQQ-binding-like beta-propeller repeat protein [Thermomicrobiales bacterium]
MRVPSSQLPTRERGLMVMTGVALITSLLLGGAAGGSLLSSRGAAWEGTVARSVSAVEPAPATPTATPVPPSPPCWDDAETHGPVGPPVERWRFERGRTVFSAPVLANGVLFVGSWGGYLYAIDARTGADRWTYRTGRMVHAAPLTGAGLVYAADMDGTVHAVDASTGHPLWRVAARDYPAMALAGDALLVVSGKNGSAPAVAGDTVYVGGGNDDLIVQSLDASTGAERWRVHLTRHGLYALDTATGVERWQFGTETWVSAAPAVAGDWIYVVDEALHKVNAATGWERWRVPMERDIVVRHAVARSGMVHLVVDVSSQPADSAGVVSAWVYAFDAVSGAERWRFPTGSAVSSAPAVAGDTVYVGGDARNLYALNEATGEVRWQFDLGARLSTPVIHCGVLYVGLHGGSLVAIANS